LKINKTTYLNGKSVFTVSLVVLVITILTVYITGINYNRSVTSNLYISLSIIGASLFLFMTYGLFNGVGLVDNFPKFKNFKMGNIISNSGTLPDLPPIEAGDGIGGLILSILLWIGMTILFFILLILLEAVFWISIFIILAMLYWLFFRALKLVFSKSKLTQGNLKKSIVYSFIYSVLYLGWIFGIIYSAEIFR